MFLQERRLRLLLMLSFVIVFSDFFQNQEETSHKKVEPITKTSTEINKSKVSEEGIKISSPSVQDSEKVCGLVYSKKSDLIVSKCLSYG